jgi:hypothetical protein
MHLQFERKQGPPEADHTSIRSIGRLAFAACISLAMTSCLWFPAAIRLDDYVVTYDATTNASTATEAGNQWRGVPSGTPVGGAPPLVIDSCETNLRLLYVVSRQTRHGDVMFSLSHAALAVVDRDGDETHVVKPNEDLGSTVRKLKRHVAGEAPLGRVIPLACSSRRQAKRATQCMVVQDVNKLVHDQELKEDESWGKEWGD